MIFWCMRVQLSIKTKTSSAHTKHSLSSRRLNASVTYEVSDGCLVLCRPPPPIYRMTACCPTETFPISSSPWCRGLMWRGWKWISTPSDSNTVRRLSNPDKPHDDRCCQCHFNMAGVLSANMEGAAFIIWTAANLQGEYELV